MKKSLFVALVATFALSTGVRAEEPKKDAPKKVEKKYELAVADGVVTSTVLYEKVLGKDEKVSTAVVRKAATEASAGVKADKKEMFEQAQKIGVQRGDKSVQVKFEKGAWNDKKPFFPIDDAIAAEKPAFETFEKKFGKKAVETVTGWRTERLAGGREAGVLIWILYKNVDKDAEFKTFCHWHAEEGDPKKEELDCH